mgnify:CR=1 FL=1
MDIYLLQLLGNWLSVLLVTLVSFFNIGNYDEEKSDLENLSYTKTATVLNEVVNYKTEYVYNSNKSADSSPEVIREGEYGLIYRYENGDTKVFKNAVNRIVEIGTAKAVKYTGRMTAYTPYCVGCSKVGNVACMAKGKKHSLITNGQYYVDSEYGKVRIVAAALSAFPCGTIVTIDNGKLPVFNAIVLDTGGSMRQAITKGVVWMDLAYSNKNDSEMRLAGSKNVSYTVRRWGW